MANNVFHIFNWHSWMLGLFQAYSYLLAPVIRAVTAVQKSHAIVVYMWSG